VPLALVDYEDDEEEPEETERRNETPDMKESDTIVNMPHEARLSAAGRTTLDAADSDSEAEVVGEQLQGAYH
jgi:hypothetical protein